MAKSRAGKAGTDSRSFTMKAWSFFKTKFLADAPADIVDAFEAGGLRLPKDEDDFMCVVFGAIEALSPARLLSPDILTEKDDDETRLARAVLLCVLSHPRWWQAQALEGLATNDRMVAFRQKNRKTGSFGQYFSSRSRHCSCSACLRMSRPRLRRNALLTRTSSTSFWSGAREKRLRRCYLKIL